MRSGAFTIGPDLGFKAAGGPLMGERDIDATPRVIGGGQVAGNNRRDHGAATRSLRAGSPQRLPYRVVYEVTEAENTVVVAAVLHAARYDRHWKRRV